jgi:hypothetical protein
MLTIRLTKLTNDRHRIEFVRADGSGDAAELETHSCLVHDLIHYAVESEANLKRSFYGPIAAGRRYGDMTGAPAAGEAMTTERIVVLLTKCAKGEWSAKEFVEAMQSPANGGPLAWVTLDFARATLERFRRAHGQWKATPFRQTMELKFAPNWLACQAVARGMQGPPLPCGLRRGSHRSLPRAKAGGEEVCYFGQL